MARPSFQDWYDRCIEPYLFSWLIKALIVLTCLATGYFWAVSNNSQTCRQLGYFIGKDGVYWCVHYDDIPKT